MPPVVYEDAHILVIDKPPGLVTHPGHGHTSGTLVHILQHHYGLDALSGLDPQKPGIVHRLDKDTSGVMVVAKTNQAHSHISQQFMLRQGEKLYWALTWGVPVPAFGHLRYALMRHSVNPIKRCVAPMRQENVPAKKPLPHTNALKRKEAHTQYRLLESKANVHGAIISLLECRLHTGRTHQIRVHLAHHGVPIVYDGLYGARRHPFVHVHDAKPAEALSHGSSSFISTFQAVSTPLLSCVEKERSAKERNQKNAKENLRQDLNGAHSCEVQKSTIPQCSSGEDFEIDTPSASATTEGGSAPSHQKSVWPRQCLHAHTLTIVHPATQEKMTFHAPMAQDMAYFWQTW